jgi:hypothetical protein
MAEAANGGTTEQHYLVQKKMKMQATNFQLTFR